MQTSVSDLNSLSISTLRFRIVLTII